VAYQLNPTAASLLGFLHDGPLTGWQLFRLAKDRIGDFWSLTRSQVYRELSAMAQAGLVQAGETGARDQRPFSLTDDGRRGFDAWALAEPGPESIRFPLLLMVGFGRHVPPERLAEYLRVHRAAHVERLAGYLATPPPADPHGQATLDFGIRYERAVLDWFDSVPAILGSGPDRDEADVSPREPARPPTRRG
jgi:DNA-binding PadR family transcriptional regulator